VEEKTYSERDGNNYLGKIEEEKHSHVLPGASGGKGEGTD